MKAKALLVSVLSMVMGQAGTLMASSEELKTMDMDGMRVTWLQDMAASHSRSIFPDASDALMDSLGLRDGVPSSMSAFLVEKDGKQILFDSGVGGEKSRLLALLDSMGVAPADVDYVCVTHFHGDHIGGMLNGGEAAFPNALVYASRLEYEGWMSMPSGQKAQVVKTMDAYGNRVRLFEFGDTLPCGIVAIDAVGHTPGHTVFRIGSLLIVGDILHGVALQLQNPDICASYDMDKEAAIASRKRILRCAKANGLIMGGMHFPAPGFIDLNASR